MVTLSLDIITSIEGRNAQYLTCASIVQEAHCAVVTGEDSDARLSRFDSSFSDLA